MEDDQIMKNTESMLSSAAFIPVEARKTEPSKPGKQEKSVEPKLANLKSSKHQEM